MIPFKPYKGESVDLPESINNGSMYLATDTGELFFDVDDNKRVLVSSKMTGFEITSADTINIGDNFPGGSYSNNVIIGKNNLSYGDSCVVIGGNATTVVYNSVAIGHYANINGSPGSVAIGYHAGGSGSSAFVALGSYATSGTDGVAIGHKATAAMLSIAIGCNAKGKSSNSIVIGENATADTSLYDQTLYSNNSIIIGNSAQAVASQNSIIIGYHATGGSYGHRVIAIGDSAVANSDGTIAIGDAANSYNLFSISLGGNARCSGNYATALGFDALCYYSLNATALGTNAKCYGHYSTALGTGAVTSEPNTILLGSDALSMLKCSVYLNTNSDIRDKTDITPIKNGALNFITKITPIQYVRNPRSYYINQENLTEELLEHFQKYGLCEYDKVAHNEGTKKGSRLRVGVSALEVQLIMLEVYGSSGYGNIVNDNLYDYDLEDVPEGVENQLTVAYEAFVPFLIKAILELSDKVKQLESQILV